MQIYVYIDVFWLAFGLIPHHCSPKLREWPTTLRKLHETAKGKSNVGQMPQHSASALYLEVQDNKGGRIECKAVTKKLKENAIMLEKLS